MWAISPQWAETQPHVSELKNYKLTRFSSERLLRFLTQLDRDVVFKGGFTTFQIVSKNPPAVDRSSERTQVILRALGALGL